MASPNDAVQTKLESFLGSVRAFAATTDDRFAGLRLDPAHSRLIIYRTGDDPSSGVAVEYAHFFQGTDLQPPLIRSGNVTAVAREAAIQEVVQADPIFQASGINVWRIETVDFDQPTIASYEDPRGVGIPQEVLDKLDQYPPSAIEFRRVYGVTQIGASRDADTPSYYGGDPIVGGT